jgi:hypothetical protein
MCQGFDCFDRFISPSSTVRTLDSGKGYSAVQSMSNLASEQFIQMATRSNDPAELCKATKEQLLAKKKNPLEIDDDCPICRDHYQTLCLVDRHPSTASQGEKHHRFNFIVFNLRLLSLSRVLFLY